MSVNASKCIESLLVYGVSGSGKTTQVAMMARWVYRKTGKITRLVSMSGGGWSSIQSTVDLGIIIPTFIKNREFPIETLEKFSRGWWPKDPNDPKSVLVPPEQQPDWENVGLIAFDSITEGCSWMMSHMTQAEAAGKIKVSSQPMKFRDGGTDYGSPSQAHYGNVQMRIEDFVGYSKGLRGKYILHTALELKATDDNTRLPLYGPDISGKAKTPVAPAWFDDCLHLYVTGAGGLKKGAVARVMYLVNHFEDDGIPYVAKNRGDYNAPLPDRLEGDKCDLGRFMEMLEESHKKAAEVLKKELGR